MSTDAHPTAAGFVPVPRAAVETAWLGGEAVLLDTGHARLHTLNTGSAAVWMLCDGITAVSGIAEALTDVFGLPGPEAASAAANGVQALWDAGLLDGSPALELPDDTDGPDDPPTGDVEVLRPPLDP